MDERDRVLDDVAARLAVPARLIRLNDQTGARVLLAAEERDGEKVWHLPEEHHREEQHAGHIEAFCRRRPPMSGGIAPGTAPTRSAAALCRFNGV